MRRAVVKMGCGKGALICSLVKADCAGADCSDISRWGVSDLH
jgi:hypothetical protein